MAELRVNDAIRVPTVRLIGADGQQLGVVPTPRALALAQSEGFDLMEIAPNAQPPVAKIGDYGKYRFDEQQKLKEAKKKQKAVIWKEIRMAPKIDEHDIETKMKAAARFLDEGDKLKITVRFRGRELAHPDRGRALLLSMGERLKEHGVIERMPLLEGRQMIMVMNPVRPVQTQNAPRATGTPPQAPQPPSQGPGAGTPAPRPAPRPAAATPAAAPRPATAPTPAPRAATAPSAPGPAAAPRPPARSRPA
ncbi:MAG TPA: translation initiation factor IF-3 [Candidatus Limnocylindria bacterium]|nr:translation initiation factor IF-3 [Candidatus Limnocylindria bacterium]